MATTKDDISQRELQRRARERFHVAERLEVEYLRNLRQLTRQVDHIIKGMATGKDFDHVTDSIKLQNMLRQYSATIEPWARSVANKMVWRIAKTDEGAWIQMGKLIGRTLKKELDDAPTGQFLQSFLEEQVKLITSLPVDAASRVHEMTLEGITKGTRAREVAKSIMETGKVIESRARLIARTEVARTASGLTVARATHIGCTHYRWRTSGDSDVRESHQKMNNVIVPFDTMPEVEAGHRYHAGMFPNCRCYIEPILIDED